MPFKPRRATSTSSTSSASSYTGSWGGPGFCPVSSLFLAGGAIVVCFIVSIGISIRNRSWGSRAIASCRATSSANSRFQPLPRPSRTHSLALIDVAREHIAAMLAQLPWVHEEARRAAGSAHAVPARHAAEGAVGAPSSSVFLANEGAELTVGDIRTVPAALAAVHEDARSLAARVAVTAEKTCAST